MAPTLPRLLKYTPWANKKSINWPLAARAKLFFFNNTEIGWETGTANTAYELRLIGIDTFNFSYLTKEMSRDCCTFFELVEMESDAVETLYMDATDSYQFLIKT